MKNASTTRTAGQSSTPSSTPPAEVPDEEYPLILTSGRVVYQYLSYNQTRHIGFLVQQCPEPYVEIHPETAARLKVSDGERVKVVSRRGYELDCKRCDEEAGEEGHPGDHARPEKTT